MLPYHHHQDAYSEQQRGAQNGDQAERPSGTGHWQQQADSVPPARQGQRPWPQLGGSSTPQVRPLAQFKP